MASRVATESLWRDRSFVLFWIARSVSLAGSAVTSVVLPALVYDMTGSAFFTGLLSAVGLLPTFVLGLFAGALADRTDRRRLVVGCEAVSALLLASIPAADLLGLLTLPHILVVAFLAGTVAVWFEAASLGVLPALVGPGQIVAANSALFTTMPILRIAALPVGGLLAASLGPAVAIGVDAASYAVAAALLLLIPRSLSTERGDEERPASQFLRTLGDIRDGVAFVWRQRLVRTLTLVGFGNSLTGGAVSGLLVVYAVQGLGLPSGGGGLGALFAAGAVGSALAGILLPRLARRYPVGWITLTAMGLNLLLLLGLAVNRTFGAGLVLYALWMLTNVLIVINGISLRQMVTPDHLQGRVNMSARMIAMGGAPLGAAVGGLLAEAATIRVAFLVMGVGIAVSVAVGLFSPLRERTIGCQPASQGAPKPDGCSLCGATCREEDI